ncbi:unnamed protein product [Mytilus edulis]|uniref:PHD-type domain-containing protein n=1 Tax=Mytilus edulis TaxID=6550 RepID=A0A8S3R6S3_MYTED|nr:unnamed protein product [Mytilus edulis]
MSGIEQNPGPRHPKFPCGICKKACKLQSIACDECDQWLHKICIGMSTTEFSRLGNSSDTWKCPNCAAPNNSSIIYSTPELDENNTNEQIINQSEHPSLIHSESDISFPSTSSITNETRSSVNTEHDSTFDILPESNGITTSSPIKPKSKTFNRANNTKGLRILNINFQSLRKKGKLLELIIIDTDPDIILGTETWLDDTISSSEILSNDLDYNIQRRDRPTDRHGGVLIAAKKHLQLHNVYKSKNIEMISGVITTNSKKITLASYYRPPNRTDNEYLEYTQDEFNRLKNSTKKNILIIGGDFNIPDINWEQLAINEKKKTLDLILTSHPSFKQRCKPIPAIGNSDHDIVLLDTSIKAQKPKPVKRKIQLWKRTNIDEIQNEVRLFAETFNQKTFSNIENMWKYFKENIMKIIDQKVPTKMTTTKFTHPWINTNIKRLIRRKNKAHKKSRKTKKKRDRDRYKYLQQQTQMEIRKAHKEYMNDIISLSYTEKPKKSLMEQTYPECNSKG